MDKIGPICRSVEDCALVFDVIHGSDNRDGTVKDLPFNWDPDSDIHSLKIGYVESSFAKAHPNDQATLKKLSNIPTEKEIKKALKDRDDWDRVCVSDKFEFIDQKLQDSFQDDLFFPDDMPEKEITKLSKLFSKKGETLFEQEGWQIVDTELYFEANIKIIKSNKYPL